MRTAILVLTSLALALTQNACTVESGGDPESDESAYTSSTAKLYDFEFDGEVTSSSPSLQEATKSQMLFTIGQLNGEGGVARLDKVTYSNVKTTRVGALTKHSYRAKLPVSWPKNNPLGRTYTLKLPRQVDWAAQEAFFGKYAATCTDPAAHDNETGIFWYYYRPNTQGCTLQSEVVSMKAQVRVSPENTLNSYPEYDKVWSDKQLRFVVIFGKVEDGAQTDADMGIESYNTFVATMERELPQARTTPSNAPANPGIAMPEVTVDGTLPDGKKVSVTTFLVDNVRQGGAAFEARYNALSTDADVIVYNGHAGLGENVRKLAAMGTFRAKQYQVVYMNGCDTFAYVDGSLAQSRARLNPDDPTGTKYMEIITNSFPPNWNALPENTIALVRALMKFNAPMSYKSIFETFNQTGLPVVTGDEDNTFRP
jgi:hypothetical protein